MRLDAVSAPAITTNVKLHTAKGGTLSLSEGDVLNVRVVSARDDTVSLKTPDGTVFRARLEGGITLPPGTEATLVVTRQAGDTVMMSFAEPGAIGTLMPQAQENPAVEAVLNQLAQMGAKPEAAAGNVTRELLAALPGLTINEAAFMVAHKLQPEPAVLDAVRAMLSGRADTASMLEALGNLASQAGENTAQAAPASVAENPQADALSVLKEALAQAKAPATELPANAAQPQAKGAELQGTAAENTAALRGTAAEGTTKPPEFTQWLSRALGVGESMPELSSHALAKSPALESLPMRSLAGIAESLGNIAKSMPELGSETELFKSIAKFAGETLLNPRGSAEEAAAALKAVREELYVKLAYFKDAVAMSGAASKSVVLEHTQKLMDHVRLLSGLDQFVCLQLPVQLGEERRNAELYVYKKEKGGSKRVDPEDVKILLALDLTNMGHLEAFIEVKGRDVSLRFEVEDDVIASTIRQNTTKLHELLDESGYKFTNSSVLTKKSETNIETALLSLLNYEKSIGVGLDFRV